MRVLYRCKCMDGEAGVEVRNRIEGEDVVYWVEQVVGAAVGADHRSRSPMCPSSTMEYVKIPAPENAPFIGGKPRLDS